jgi:hypothetical protein
MLKIRWQWNDATKSSGLTRPPNAAIVFVHLGMSLGLQLSAVIQEWKKQHEFSECSLTGTHQQSSNHLSPSSP